MASERFGEAHSSGSEVELIYIGRTGRFRYRQPWSAGLTAADLIAASKIETSGADLPSQPRKLGIYGERIDSSQLLEPGDRVEIYRELELDPMSARRARAAATASQRGR